MLQGMYLKINDFIKMLKYGNKKTAEDKKADIFITEKRNACHDIKFTRKVLNEFRKNVGKYPAETGGMLGSKSDEKIIDICYFDHISKNTPGTFYYDVVSMSKVFRSWKASGVVTNGIYHSHPAGAVCPSYHDVSTSWIHMKFFRLDYFYLPIFQSSRNGEYRMYFYVINRFEKTLLVHLKYIIQADAGSYRYISFLPWRKLYEIDGLENYRRRISERCSKVQTENMEYHKNENKKAVPPPAIVIREPKGIGCLSLSIKTQIQDFTVKGDNSYGKEKVF